MEKIKQKTKNKFVKDIDHLKELIKKGQHEYALLLGGGTAYSLKDIEYDPKKDIFTIFNYIDESTIKLTTKEVEKGDYTHIGTAIPLKSLIAII
jgi:hypothetical protein